MTAQFYRQPNDELAIKITYKPGKDDIIKALQKAIHQIRFVEDAFMQDDSLVSFPLKLD